MMWNNCIQLHASFLRSKSTENRFTMAAVSPMHKLSIQVRHVKLCDEVPTAGRGQKPATTNGALQIGLQDSAISNTKMYYLLTSANVPPPSRRGMQTNANKITSITAQHTVDDLKQKPKLQSGICDMHRMADRQTRHHWFLPGKEAVQTGFNTPKQRL